MLGRQWGVCLKSKCSHIRLPLLGPQITQYFFLDLSSSGSKLQWNLTFRQNQDDSCSLDQRKAYIAWKMSPFSWTNRRGWGLPCSVYGTSHIEFHERQFIENLIGNPKRAESKKKNTKRKGEPKGGKYTNVRIFCPHRMLIISNLVTKHSVRTLFWEIFIYSIF